MPKTSIKNYLLRTLNSKDTKNGVIKGGFDRVNLFQQAEQGFDKLFDYNRQQSESFNYHNTMKNSSIPKQIELQEQKISGEKKKETFQSDEKYNKIFCNLASKQDNKYPYNLQNSNDSLLSIFSLGDGNNYNATLAEELQAKKHKKKKKKEIR